MAGFNYTIEYTRLAQPILKIRLHDLYERLAFLQRCKQVKTVSSIDEVRARITAVQSLINVPDQHTATA